MRTTVQRFTMIIASLSLAAGSLLAGSTAAGAAAVDCRENVGANGPGEGRTISGANMKTGPYADCGNVEWMPAGTHVYYWCYVANDFGNTWTYARIAGTETKGWILDDRLPLNSDGTRGSETLC